MRMWENSVTVGIPETSYIVKYWGGVQPHLAPSVCQRWHGRNDPRPKWLMSETTHGRNRVESESPCRAELPTYIVYFFQIHPRWRFFINNFYLISSHILKSISGKIIIKKIVYDFIAILLLAGGLKTTAEWIKVSIDFYWKFERSTSEFGKHSENKR